MERLTLSNNEIHTNAGIWILKNGNPKGLVSDDCDEYEYFKKLAEYEDLEEQGKLLKLPCAVGDMVYVLEADEENFEHFHCGAKISEIEFDYWMIPLFEKCVFLTRQEAEAALEETKKGSVL